MHLIGVYVCICVYISIKRKIRILDIVERFCKYYNGKVVAEIIKRLHLKFLRFYYPHAVQKISKRKIPFKMLTVVLMVWLSGLSVIP